MWPVKKLPNGKLILIKASFRRKAEPVGWGMQQQIMHVCVTYPGLMRGAMLLFTGWQAGMSLIRTLMGREMFCPDTALGGQGATFCLPWLIHRCTIDRATVPGEHCVVFKYWHFVLFLSIYWVSVCILVSLHGHKYLVKPESMNTEHCIHCQYLLTTTNQYFLQQSQWWFLELLLYFSFK